MLGKARFPHALRLLLGVLVLLWWAIHVLTWGAAILAYWPIWLLVLPLWALIWLGAKELLTKRTGMRAWLVALVAGLILATELASLCVFDTFWVPPYILVTSLLIVSLLKNKAA